MMRNLISKQITRQTTLGTAKKILTFILAIQALTFVACSKKDDSDKESGLLKEWDHANAPERMGLEKGKYETNFKKLPLQAALPKLPWSGGYWPTYHGGITYRWNHPSQDDNSRVFYDLLDMSRLTPRDIVTLSPAEKYDIFLGDPTFSLTRKERNRTQIFRTRTDSNFTIPRWEGLCHAWAPATLLYDHPKPVTLPGKSGVNVAFGSADIKALLTYFLHERSSMVFFMSRRCDLDFKKLREQLDRGQITHQEYIHTIESANCEGVNPGALHILLANYLAFKKEGFIADVTRDAEVWNQAVHSYKSKVVEERKKISAQAAPGTVKEIKVETQMTYTVEISESWERIETPVSNRTVLYTYWLELNKKDEIIGGSWVSELRPDFFWTRNKPEFTGAYLPLKKIYEASVSDIHGRRHSIANEDGTSDDNPDGDDEADLGDNPADQPDSSGFINLKVEAKKAVVGYNIQISGSYGDKTSSGVIELRSRSHGRVVYSTKIPDSGANGEFSINFSTWNPFANGKVYIIGFDTNKSKIGETAISYRNPPQS